MRVLVLISSPQSVTWGVSQLSHRAEVSGVYASSASGCLLLLLAAFRRHHGVSSVRMARRQSSCGSVFALVLALLCCKGPPSPPATGRLLTHFNTTTKYVLAPMPNFLYHHARYNTKPLMDSHHTSTCSNIGTHRQTFRIHTKK